MKYHLLAPILAMVTTAFAVPALSQPSPPNPKRIVYSCSPNDGTPTTFAQTPKGTVEVIRWQSKHFSSSGFGPDQRCQLITERLQKFSDEGALRYITTGKMNNQNVMCVALGKGGDCRSDGLLLTFEPKDNPQAVLKELFKVSTGASTAPLLRGNTKVYVDMDEFLNNAANAQQPSTSEGEATDGNPNHPVDNGHLW